MRVKGIIPSIFRDQADGRPVVMIYYVHALFYCIKVIYWNPNPQTSWNWVVGSWSKGDSENISTCFLNLRTWVEYNSYEPSLLLDTDSPNLWTYSFVYKFPQEVVFWLRNQWRMSFNEWQFAKILSIPFHPSFPHRCCRIKALSGIDRLLTWEPQQSNILVPLDGI